jgi:predicted O-methyltransferase YrrM
MQTLPDGWLSKQDEAELRRLATGKTVLELGAWHGRSTVVLSDVAKYVVSVDRHEGIAGTDDSDSLPEYLEHVRPLRNVALVVAHFQDFVPLLSPFGAFGLAFIDGDHDYRAVLRDIALALHVDPPVVAMHDYDYDEVRQAATEVFGKPHAVKGSVASFRRLL